LISSGETYRYGLALKCSKLTAYTSQMPHKMPSEESKSLLPALRLSSPTALSNTIISYSGGSQTQTSMVLASEDGGECEGGGVHPGVSGVGAAAGSC
jgi:hypothetical protein